MNILSFNSRGLGSGVKWSAIRKLALTNNLDILCIQETKMESIDRRLCQYLWGDCNASWECAPSINVAGGLLPFSLVVSSLLFFSQKLKRKLEGQRTPHSLLSYPTQSC